MRALVFVLAIGAMAVFGQASRTFDVVSIKPDTSPKSMNFHVSAERVDGYENLRRLIGTAYYVPDFRIVGAPAWAESQRYEIAATASTPFSNAEMQSMMQAVLADRFRLAIHHDTREFSGYILSVAKGGLKLQQTTDPNPKSADAISYRRDPESGAILLEGTDISISHFALAFGVMLQLPIRDDTGLAGNFDIKLRFTVDPNAGVSDVPPLTTAMQEQLGLHMESAKLPQDVIVVDRAERPSEN